MQICTRYIILILLSFFILNNLRSQSTRTISDKKTTIINGKDHYIYNVKKGETLYRISMDYGVSISELLNVNENLSKGLNAGQRIFIPVIEGRNKSTVLSNFIYHTIEKGQTVYFLTRMYHISQEQILKLNPQLKVNNLQVGTVIKIPADNVVNKKDGSRISEDKQFFFHKIVYGETLFSLSIKYETTIDNILKQNQGLNSQTLKINNVIRIPKEIHSVSVPPKRTDIDENYIHHMVIADETLETIAQKYNINPKILEEHNSDIPLTLQEGKLIYVPKRILTKQTLIDESKFSYHTVRRGETLYSISKKYNITLDDIKKINPNTLSNTIKKGAKIKIPEGITVVVDTMMVTMDGSNTNMQTSLSDIHNCNEYDYYENRKFLNIAILLPFYLNINRATINSAINSSHSQNNYTIYTKSSIPLQLYTGILMAIDKWKQQGANIKVTVYDTQNDSNVVKNILRKSELKEVDMIVGPAYYHNVSIVSKFSQQNNITLISPLSNKTKGLLNKNPLLFQVNATNETLYPLAAKYFAEKNQHKNIIVIRYPNDKIKKEYNFIKNFKHYLFPEQSKVTNDVKYYEIYLKKYGSKAIENVLKKGEENIVIIPSQEEALVNDFVATLSSINKKYPITLIGFPKWRYFESIEPEYYHKLNLHIFSQSTIDYSNKEVTNFAANYYKTYYMEPNFYSFYGYDIMDYFLNLLTKYGNDFEYCIPDFQKKLFISNIKFVRNSLWGGYENNGMLILNYNSEYNIHTSDLY